MHFGCIFAMACHMRLFFLCFLNGNGVFPFLGAPADYFNSFLALDSVFGAILSLRFEFCCHFQHWLEFLQAILSTGFAFWRHFEHRVRSLSAPGRSSLPFSAKGSYPGRPSTLQPTISSTGFVAFIHLPQEDFKSLLLCIFPVRLLKIMSGPQVQGP